jgi:hypothetical protein
LENTENAAPENIDRPSVVNFLKNSKTAKTTLKRQESHPYFTFLPLSLQLLKHPAKGGGQLTL